MRRARLTALIFATALALGVSCGKSKPVGVEDAGLASCLDSPDQLTRAPSATLPCELIPPGLTL